MEAHLPRISVSKALESAERIPDPIPKEKVPHVPMSTSMPRQHTGETVVGVWTFLTRVSGFACIAFGQVACILVVASAPIARTADVSNESSNEPRGIRRP